jgi:hypothetical protein
VQRCSVGNLWTKSSGQKWGGLWIFIVIFGSVKCLIFLYDSVNQFQYNFTLKYYTYVNLGVGPPYLWNFPSWFAQNIDWTALPLCCFNLMLCNSYKQLKFKFGFSVVFITWKCEVKIMARRVVWHVLATHFLFVFIQAMGKHCHK